MNDDHGDQFPGAVPATTVPTALRPAGADDRLVRMSAAYTEKINAAVQADRESLAYELAERTFAEEMSGSEPAGDRSPARRPAGRRTRSPGHRPPTALGRMGGLTRRSLDRFDRYTLDVFNPRPPHAQYASQPDRSA
jgi:hypothetical protein